MGLGDFGMQQAVSLGQKNVEKYIAKLSEQNEAIIDRLNWQMKAIQQICNSLDIKLKDPLEETK